jgi:EAL domain-containing protein (putative c-di-GMP-specific phosphodiesterase class I)
MQTELQEALEQQQLRLYYQPAYSLTDATIGSVEALLRWDSPERGIIAPAQFIAEAEESGLIVELGGWAIREACRQLARWQTSLVQADLYVTVNVSAPQLTEQDLVGAVRESADRADALVAYLALELSAADLARASERAVLGLAELEQIGAGVVVDGLADQRVPLARLHALPLRALKIGAEVVAGLPDDTRCTELAEATIETADSLGVETVAQGVETPGQVQALRGLGCESAAGFLYALPMPPDALEDALRGRARKNQSAGQRRRVGR